MAKSGAGRRVLHLLLICVAGIALNVWIAVNNDTGFGVDFNQFYAASHLAGTGHLYDWDALRKLEAAHGPEVRTGRLPVVAFGMKLLGWLPYPAAHLAWLAISFAALIVFAMAWPETDRLLMAAALAWSMPATLLLVLGQDTPLWLLFFTLALVLMAKGRPALAGIAFALCIAKFHLAVAVPVMLIAQRRWKTVGAATAAVAVLVGSCFVIEGADWPRRYLAMVTQPLFSPAHERMPNVRGLAAWLPASVIVEVAGAAAVIALLWVVCRGSSIGIAGAATAACGLILGRHAYANDCALLIPLAVLVVQLKFAPRLLKVWAVLLLSPLLTLLLTSSKPFSGQIAVVGFVIAALVYARRPVKTAAV